MAYNRERAERPAPEFIEKVVYLNRVSKTVKGGHVYRLPALWGCGDAPLPGRRTGRQPACLLAAKVVNLPLLFLTF